MISKQEIEQLGSPVGLVSFLFPVHEWKLSIYVSRAMCK